MYSTKAIEQATATSNSNNSITILVRVPCCIIKKYMNPNRVTRWGTEMKEIVQSSVSHLVVALRGLWSSEHTSEVQFWVVLCKSVELQRVQKLVGIRHLFKAKLNNWLTDIIPCRKRWRMIKAKIVFQYDLVSLSFIFPSPFARQMHATVHSWH